MTLPEFQAWSLGQGSVGKATDGGYVGECVSLINQYLSKVHGINAGAWGHAKSWADGANPIRQWFTAVNQSQPGDIGVSTSGPYGHIWIYTANGILEQNGRVSRKVSASPDRGATVILRPKAGMPANQSQGGDMPTKVNTGLLRIIHTEMEGWPYERTHNGEFDAAFNASWGNSNLEDVMWEKWNKNGPWRAQREANRIFFEQNSTLLDTLKANPTKAQYDEVVQQMKAEQAKVEAANKALAEAQAKSTEDTELLNTGSSFLKKLLKRLGF